MKLKEIILTYVKGICMGAADVVPGVSGGTIAFITGIYERFVLAIKSVNFANMKLFFTGKWKLFWKNIDGTFLLCLFLGIGTSFLLLARLITYWMSNYPVLVWAFFFGLILASTVFVSKSVQWNWKTILAFIIFAVLAFFIASPQLAPLSQNNALWYIFICGAIAICAMILPGISGSFILVLLGEYFYMMTVLSELQITVLLIFLCGAVLGLVTFANVIAWLFKHFKMITLASLTGFMFGSMNKIWPWKVTLETYINNHGQELPLRQKNILPQQFDSQFFIAIALIVVGFLLIFVIEKLAARLHQQDAQKTTEA